jgi:DNA-binding FadR family transcriptional regulator
MMKARTYPRRGLHGEVVHEMGLRIIRGELAPGDPLPAEDCLRGGLAVSRTVLREATKVLAAKRLVESRPKTGTRVLPRRDWNMLDPDVLAWHTEAMPSDRFVEQLFEVRDLIEPPAVRLAAERATAQQIAQLEEAQREMEQAGENAEAFIEPDIRFHTLIFESSQNELLAQMATILGSVLRTIFTYSGQPGRFRHAARRHGAVVDAILAHDPDAAEAALRELISEAKTNVARARATGDAKHRGRARSSRRSPSAGA